MKSIVIYFSRAGYNYVEKEYPQNLDDYDVIYLGYPNYWGTMPMVMFTFLENAKLTNKIIKPFCSHEGSGLGKSEIDIRKLCQNCTVKNGLAIHGANYEEEQLKDWLKIEK